MCTSIREDFCGNDSSILFLGITGSLAYILHSISELTRVTLIHVVMT